VMATSGGPKPCVRAVNLAILIFVICLAGVLLQHHLSGSSSKPLAAERASAGAAVEAPVRSTWPREPLNRQEAVGSIGAAIPAQAGRFSSTCELHRVDGQLHVITAGGGGAWPKMMATSMFTIMRGAKFSERLVVHLVIREEDAADVALMLGLRPGCGVRRIGGSQVIVQRLSEMDTTRTMPHAIKRARLAAPENYVRFALDTFIEEGTNAIAAWLDADTLVYGNLVQVADHLRRSSKEVGVVHRVRNISRHIVWQKAGALKKDPGFMNLINKGIYFQAMLVLVKMDWWREKHMSTQVQRWIKTQDAGVWLSGSQMVMNVLLQYPLPGEPSNTSRLLLLDPDWNRKSSDALSVGCKVPQAGMLHFSGNRPKPFTKPSPPCQILWDEAYQSLQAEVKRALQVKATN